MSKLIVDSGEPFALLVEGQSGMYLVPPIVLDGDGNVIEGHEVLEAMRQAGVKIESTDSGVWSGHTPGGAEVQHPVLTGRTTADLAAIDQRMALISDKLGIPIGPPD
jgi:hypothetical protein